MTPSKAEMGGFGSHDGFRAVSLAVAFLVSIGGSRILEL